MVHIPSAYAFDFWLQEPSSEKVELSCLMPNGTLIVLDSSRFASLQEIKEDLWEAAASGKYPLYNLLRDASTYIFSCISAIGETEEIRDETRRLCDIRPFGAILKLVEFKEDDDNHQINFQISNLLGKGIHEFNALKNPEVNDFRHKMKILGLEVAKMRRNRTWKEKLAYQYSPRLAAHSGIPPNIQNSHKLRDGNFFVVLRIPKFETSFKMNIAYNVTPQQLLKMALNKKSLSMKLHDESYVLKVIGQEEYLTGDYPLIQFLYIQECLSRDLSPQLALVSADSVQMSVESFYEDVGQMEAATQNHQMYTTMTLRKNKGKTVSSWTIDDLFSIQIVSICRINTDAQRTVEVGVQAGLFHGGKPLCETRKTQEKVVQKDGFVDLQEHLQFDIRVCNIPRMARLCLSLYEVSKTAKGIKTRKVKDGSKQELFMNPLAWVNTTVYDFKSQMKTGLVTLHMWTYADDSQTDELLQSLGTVVCNGNVDHVTALTLSFGRHHPELSVLYPSLTEMLTFAETQGDAREWHLKQPLMTEETKQMLDAMRQQADSDPLRDMHEQEMRALWDARYQALKYAPTLLPKFLDAVEWNDYKQVAEAMYMLERWSHLPVEKALELLDYAYADQFVRNFAVRCLNTITDEELFLYLLQLVQAIKHESFLNCDLVQFLLKRALNNRKIGHFLFWHLRSEMSFPGVSVRFGLILEAYCCGSLEHLASLTHQLEYLRILKETSESLRKIKDREKLKQSLQEQLCEKHFLATMADVISPLDPRFRFKSIRVDKCRVMDSKMRPLYIVMENHDPMGDDVFIIFKNGDDLRQDMLALQMIKIMDMLWKNEGLDLRMNPYGCVATDHRVGLIEVVLNAETIANIQKEKGMFTATSAFNKGSILAWLKDNNTDDAQLMKAIEEFTLSCAGYCVATYVLGVADRHSDNIMIKRSGQLFHIDFGHILGHFKEKFGFRRERVPFVLTHDFVYVINKGQKDKKEAVEFQMFQSYCEKAFLILRQHGGLFLSLFAMMISTGLPELSSEEDLNYLRETLVLDLSEQEALQHFRGKFYEALANSWKTSLNWASHNLAKNNKQ